MAMNYYQYVTRLMQNSDTIQSDTDLTTLVPAVIDYAEQRIYRDLNLLNVTVRDNSVTLTANSRNVTLPGSVTGSTQVFMTITSVNVITPVGSLSSNGTRNAMARAWQGFVDYLYPTDVSTGAASVPSVYAVIGSTNPTVAYPAMIVGPAPGSSYSLEITGTVRPTALSSGNTLTYLSQFLPDLFLAASMVYVADNMRQTGQPPHNPQMGQMWEEKYQALLRSAQTEEARKRYSEHMLGGADSRETEK